MCLATDQCRECMHLREYDYVEYYACIIYRRESKTANIICILQCNKNMFTKVWYEIELISLSHLKIKSEKTI